MNEKPIFRSRINYKRCVVLAEGYYEWITAIYTEDNSVFLLTFDSFG